MCPHDGRRVGAAGVDGDRAGIGAAAAAAGIDGGILARFHQSHVWP